MALLAADLATIVDADASGRFSRVNSPGNDPPPRAILMSCAEGALVGVRADVEAERAAAVRAIVAGEPPWNDPEQPPVWRAAIAEALGLPPEAESAVPGPIYALPRGLAFETEAAIVLSEEPGGEVLLARLRREGMSPAMVAAGFTDAGELWPPWCVAIVDGDIAATAFAARTGAGGLEVGVYTLEAFRGRALAAAVTAAWTRLPSLEGRTLFYSTSVTNRASQAVTAKLGLRRFGVSLGIG
jgi:hypothetical protein